MSAKPFDKRFEANFAICPHCGSKDIQNNDDTMDDRFVFVHVSCNTCDATWREDYELRWRTNAGQGGNGEVDLKPKHEQAASRLLEALKGARELILNMGTVIRGRDDENEHLELWTNDGTVAGGVYVPDERFQAIEEVLKEVAE